MVSRTEGEGIISASILSGSDDTLTAVAVVPSPLSGSPGAPVTAKYIGPRRLMEVAVATLATDRALLLLGVPGTAKTWVSENWS